MTVGHRVSQFFDHLLQTFDINGIEILFVLDGARNPLKAATNEAREKKSNDAKCELSDLIKTGDPEQLKKITALKKKAVYVREDILADFVAWCSRKKIM